MYIFSSRGNSNHRKHRKKSIEANNSLLFRATCLFIFYVRCTVIGIGGSTQTSIHWNMAWKRYLRQFIIFSRGISHFAPISLHAIRMVSKSMNTKEERRKKLLKIIIILITKGTPRIENRIVLRIYLFVCRCRRQSLSAIGTNELYNSIQTNVRYHRVHDCLNS